MILSWLTTAEAKTWIIDEPKIYALFQPLGFAKSETVAGERAFGRVGVGLVLLGHLLLRLH